MTAALSDGIVQMRKFFCLEFELFLTALFFFSLKEDKKKDIGNAVNFFIFIYYKKIKRGKCMSFY